MASSSLGASTPCPSAKSDIQARPYQLELLEAAIKENTIVLLGTGGGKTFVAVMLIRELSQNITRPFSDLLAKRTVFLVNTVPLASQQARYIETHTGFSVGVYVGMDAAEWSQKRWMEELDQHYVLVMTHDFFHNHLLTPGYLPLSKVNLIIFDECHHAAGKHPYAQIMRRFSSYPKERWPHILGLSASIISGRCKPGMLSNKLSELECTLHCRIETARDLKEVSCYVTNPEESFVVYSSHKNPTVKLLKKSLEEVLQFLDARDSTPKQAGIKEELKSSLADCKYALEEINISSALSAAEIASGEVKVMLDEKGTDQWKLKLVQMVLTSLACFRQKCHALLQKERDDNSQKLTKLLQVIAEIDSKMDNTRDLSTHDKICGIVFVQRRIAAVCLAKVITDFRNHFPHIHCHHIVGHNSKLGNLLDVGGHMSIAKQEEVLRKFRTGSINLLVATSVVEEGIDVPKCNLVVRYDFPLTFQSYVQSKGRARAKNSQYCLLVEDEKHKECTLKLREFCALEEELQKVCHGREVPDVDALQQKMEHLVPPYKPFPGYGTPEVTVDQSLSLLYRYCQMLPSDRYTFLAPSFETTNKEGVCPLDKKQYPNLFQSTVSLPLACPLKGSIQGLPVPYDKLSRKSAALEVVKRLHEEGELDDFLKPIPHTTVDSDEEDREKMVEKKKQHAGTNRRVMYYKNVVPACFQNCQPVTGSKNHLYFFVIRERKSGKLYCAQGECVARSMLGIITTTTIPWKKIPKFSLYVKRTELSVSVVKNPIACKLSASELKNIRAFHETLFTKILGMAGTKMSFHEADRGCIVVPVRLRPGSELECVLDVAMISRVVSNSTAEISQPTFDVEDFVDVLVSKSYTEEGERGAEQLYEITALNKDEYPDSKFEDQEVLTFAEYFRQKYNYEFKNYKQHSLTCRPVGMGEKSMQLTASHFKDDSVPQSDLKRKEIKLFPELCKIYHLPASFWKLCRCIPSLLHRLEALLIAEELSNEVPDIGEFHDTDGSEWEITTKTELRGHQDHAVGPLPTAYWKRTPFEEVVDSTNELSEAIPSIHASSRKADSGILLQALTPAGAMDSIDLERLESLGDSFLKLVTSVDLYCTRVHDHEGKLTHSRTHRISNFNLSYLAKRRGIPGFIQSKRLEPLKTWLPPSFIVDQFEVNLPSMARSSDVPESVRDYMYHKVTDKGIADAVEALIGSYIVAGGIEAGLKFLEWLGLKLAFPVKDCGDAMEQSSLNSEEAMSIDDPSSPYEAQMRCTNSLLTSNASKVFSTMYSFPEACLPGGLNKVGVVEKLLSSASYIPLCERLQWQFSNGYSKALLLQALTHPSYVKNRVTESYQRLEFLGDAILDYLVTCTIYSRFPDYSPGKISDLRSALVSNVTLAQIAVQKLSINRHLLHLAPALLRQIHIYCDGLYRTFSKEEKEELQDIWYCNHGIEELSASADEAHAIGVVEPNQASFSMSADEDAEELDPPKALGDVVESLAGAVFLDSGMSLSAVWKVFYPFFEPLIEEYSKRVPIPPVRELYQRETEENIVFHKGHVGDSKTRNLRHRSTVIVLDKNIQVSAVAKTAKAAKASAARKALLLIDEMQKQDIVD